MNRLFLRKSVQDCENDILERGGLRRTLGKWHLTALGVGATIGAGIFATTGTAIVGDQIRLGAGPAIVLSFLLTAVTCGFAALCYAEFASMVPISGSAYTYAYASLGELVAWIIGWDLIVEYAVGNIGVAIGWSGYFRELLTHFGLALPPWLATDARSAHMAADAVAAGATDATSVYLASALTAAPTVLGFKFIANLPAFAIVALITAILVIGIRESATSNNAMVILKLAIILFFVAVGVTLIKPEHWNDPAARRLRAERVRGDQRGRGDHLLQLYRIRRHLDGGGGGEGPRPRHAVRHHHEPGDLYGRLHPRGRRDDRDGTLAQAGHGGADGDGARPGRRLSHADQDLALHRLPRRGVRHDQRAAGVPAGSAPDLHVHVARRAAAAVLLQGAPAFPDAVRRHPDHRDFRGDLRRLRQHRRGGGADQHRDAVRFHPGVGGGDPAAAGGARPAPSVPGAARAVGPDPLDRELSLPDGCSCRGSPGLGSRCGWCWGC